MNSFVREIDIKQSKWGKLFIDTYNKIKELNDVQDDKYDDLAYRCFSAAIYKDREENYKVLRDVRMSKGNHCIHRLLGIKKCEGVLCSPPGNDHGTLWLKDGHPYSYTFEPYHLSKETLQKLIDFCDEHELYFDITNRSFHNPAGTTLVEITKKK